MQKKIALFVVLPLAALFVWFAGIFIVQSLKIEHNWIFVKAVAAEVTEKEVDLDIPSNSGTSRRVVRKEDGFNGIAQGETVPLYVNPSNTAEMRRAIFSEMWLNASFMGLFVVVLGVAGIIMLRPGDGPDFAAMQAAFEADVKKAGEQGKTYTPGESDDGMPITLREPRQSWKANVFWGVVLGVPLLFMAWFAPADYPMLKRAGFGLAGACWLGFMLVKAIRNSGKTVRITSHDITVDTPLGSDTIYLRDVKRVALADVHKEMEDINNAGQWRYKTRGLNTMAQMKLYILYDAEGRSLLRLDEHMTPASEMARFRARMERVTGRMIDRE